MDLLIPASLKLLGKGHKLGVTRSVGSDVVVLTQG
jgi:hypothetical protein